MTVSQIPNNIQKGAIMKIDRQLGILSILLQTESVTTPYLSDMFEVSRRTINRMQILQINRIQILQIKIQIKTQIHRQAKRQRPRKR